MAAQLALDSHLAHTAEVSLAAGRALAAIPWEAVGAAANATDQEQQAMRGSFLELADSSINFVVRPWVKTADYWGVHFDVTEKVKLTFDEEGISIPYPQSDVHLYQAKAS